MLRALYPGSFDPVTNGHLDIIGRARVVFDQLVVAVLRNPNKTPLFTVEERAEMLRQSVTEWPNVQVETFHGLLVSFARKKECRIVVRGLRAISDYEYETQIALINRKLAPEIETIFMTTSTQFSYLNSTVVKEIAQFGGCVRDLVPPIVEQNLKAKFKKEGS